MLGCFTHQALAQTDHQYVIMHDGHYLSHINNSGTWGIGDATSFSPNSLWFSSNNYNYYFNDGTNSRYLRAPLERNGVISFSDAYPGTQVLNNTTENYYFYDWDQGLARGLQHFDPECPTEYNNQGIECWEVVWVSYENSQWQMSSIYGSDQTPHAAKFYSVTVTEHAQQISVEEGGVSSISDFELDFNESQTVSVSVTPYSYTYTPAYTTYVFNGSTHNYYNNTDNGENTPVETTSTGNDNPTYAWTLSGPGAGYLTLTGETTASPTITYNTQNTTGHKTATLTLTVTYSNGIAKQVRTAEIEVKTPCQNPAQAAAPVVSFEDVTVSWVHTAHSYNVYCKKSSEASYGAPVTVGSVTSHVFSDLEYNTPYTYKIAAICGGTELANPAPTEYTFTTKAQPDLLVYGAVFGGGRMADVTGKTEVAIINCDSIGAIYGGNDIAGAVEGAEGSKITLGVNTSNPDGYAEQGTTNAPIKIGSVYGGGNGYYAYNGNAFEPATSDYQSETVGVGESVKAMTQSHEVGEVVWTNTSSSSKELSFPAIVKTEIIVTNDYVAVDSLFGGAKNAFLTTDSGNGSTITIDGGTVFAVFGGNNFGGTQGHGKHHIDVNATKIPATLTPNIASTATTGFGRDFGIRYLFGGGNKVYGSTTEIFVYGGMTDTIFAGGNSADVYAANVTVNCSIASGSNNVFGNTYSYGIDTYASGAITPKTNYAWDGKGIYNVHTLFGGNNQASMEGIPSINLTSGSVGTVYGGGNAGDMLAHETDNGSGGELTINGDHVKYGTHVELNSPDIIVDNLYGGCQLSNVHYSTWVELKEGHVGTVYGGCNVSGDVGSTRVNLDAPEWSAPEVPNPDYQEVYGGTYVVAAGGIVYKNLFAGGNGYYHCVNDYGKYIEGIDYADPEHHYIGLSTPTHNETHVVINTGATVKGNVYAGGNLASVGFDNNSVNGNPYPRFRGLSSVRMVGGTVDGDVYGGGNMANVYGSNEVQVSGGTITGSLYGGNDRTGKVAQISNRVLPAEYNVASDGQTSLLSPKVYTYVSLTGNPTITNVFGGGNGDYAYFNNFADAAAYTGEKETVVSCDIDNQPIQRSTFVDVSINGGASGGHIGTVYGGGDGVTVTEFLKVFLNVKGTTDVSNVGTIFGGNNIGELELVPDIILLNGQVDYVYGGCNEGKMKGNKNITFGEDTYTGISSYVRLLNEYKPNGTGTPVIPTAKVMQAVYGGCKSNGTTNNSLVLVEGGNHEGVNLFGGSDVSGTIEGTSWVVVKGGTITNAYGGGNGNYDYSMSPYTGLTAPYSENARVDMLGGTVQGNLYAGGYAGECGNTVLNMEAGTVAGSLFGGGNMAGLDHNSEVEVSGGTVATGVYGGCNTTGTVGENTNVSIIGGTVNNVYGGGLGIATGVDGDVTVNIGSDTGTPTVNGNVYGGSSMGTVNNANTDLTQVNILNGTLNGDIYGGGQGISGDVNKGNVNGQVEVNIGAYTAGTYSGNATFGSTSKVFGCNDAGGSPKNDVMVNVYQTAHNTTNSYPNPVPTNSAELVGATANQFAIQAVYGGGNLADYTPASNTNTATVHVFQCDQNTIKDVYGGSNQAAAQNTHVIIDGGRIDRTFGGGNGVAGPADVLGTAKTEINAGLITQVFGGSNTNGAIGNIDLTVIPNPSCPELINEVFSGNNQAPMFGDIVTDLYGDCDDEIDGTNFYGGTNLAPIYGNVTLNVYGGYYTNVFGGSKGYIDPLDASNNIAANIMKYPTIAEVQANPGNYPDGLLAYLQANTALVGTGGNVTLNLYGGHVVNAFGGSDVLGNIEGNITVNVIDLEDSSTICPLDLTNVYGGGHDAAYTPALATNNYPEVNILNGTVSNNVFGGGLGETATVTSNPVVTIGDLTSGHESYAAVVGRIETVSGIDQYYGNVYGGGELAQVDGDTKIVMQKTNSIVQGTVYGGGMGSETDINDGLVKGNSLVDMRNGHVRRSIYGGGELGSVGTFTAYYAEGESDLHIAGEPKTCATGTGLTKVLISGGMVGLNQAHMPDPSWPTTDDDFGYVFCASKGLNSGNAIANQLAVSDSSYLEISGTAVITASIYGGSENGQVLRNTHVKITGGQIGTGYHNEGGTPTWDDAYPESQWTAAIEKIKNGTFTDTDAANFHECDAWPFNPEGQRYVYDHYAIYPDGAGNYYYDAALTQSSNGGSNSAGDGHSFYGNVFGGGSGYYPYAPGEWRRSAGRVCGDTYVEITGGHVLTNVYGGNEITDVLGHSKVKMTGGTVGVPRSLAGIQARPVNSYIFGAGMGDPRIQFNDWSNVNSAEVEIGENAVIFGSIFGGGEDGHVLNDATTTVKDNTLIGTLGTSGVDGNIFGGGRGFSGNALTAGVICGNISVNISGNAKILGSVFGGGRMAAVGTYLDSEGSTNYGVMQEGDTHGNVTVNITGGTIGNIYHLGESQFSIGDVFGGSKGTLMNDWAKSQKLGLVKNTEVNISQATGSNTLIYGSVYGGGEIASVGSYEYADADDVAAYNATHTIEPLHIGDIDYLLEDGSGNAIVNITGGTIGQADPTYTKGHVFGGCLGRSGDNYSGYSFVNRSVVTLNGGTVYGCMFGGGENGHVLDSTQVIIQDGTVGIPLDGLVLTDPDDNRTIYRGNVYGGGRGIDLDQETHEYSITAGKVSGNTNVSVTGGTIYRNVYGGGSLASVGDPEETPDANGNYKTGWATVSITGGQIGTDGGYHNSGYYNSHPFEHRLENGHVFGSGRGVAGEPGSEYTHLAYVKDSRVIIGGTAYVTGSVFGSGENGHVRRNTNVRIEAGTGTLSTTGEPYPIIGYPLTAVEMVEDVNSPVVIYRGNVYGGGRGIDHTSQTNALSATAGIVDGNTRVTIEGGTIRHNVYGGGSLARVGNPDETPQADGHYLTGHATIDIRGGQIGMSEAAVSALCGVAGNTHSGLNNGQVYGSGRGVAGAIYAQLAYVKYSHVNIESGSIFGSVFGGGANGHVRKDTEVNISGGTIGIADYNTTSEVYRGNVYGGGRGIDHDESNHTINKTEGTVLGNSNIHITGGTIYHNVYGGGSLASVGTITYGENNEVTAIEEGTGKATIVIEQAEGKTTQIGINGANNGRVFGSGRGYPGTETITVGGSTFTIDYSNLTYVNNTDISFKSGTIAGCIFGSGDNGHVFGDTKVVMSGGFLGNAAETDPTNHENDGNIFGGGRGSDRYGSGLISPTAGHVGGNTYVEVTGGEMLHNVYGGGHMASVGNYTVEGGYISGGETTIVISGGTIGIDGQNNGRIFGAGRGMAGKDTYGNDYTELTWVNNTNVTVSGNADIRGCVFGSGDNGHTWGDTHVNVTGGTIGTNGGVVDGNIFGGGRGQDTYGSGQLSPTAGMVYGNTYVDVSGGNIKANIYGGGNMSTVGKFVFDVNSSTGVVNGITSIDPNTGTTNVIVRGDVTVGGSSYGNVFGAGRGDQTKPLFARVNYTNVTIGDNSNHHTQMNNVYGGGENGDVTCGTLEVPAVSLANELTGVASTVTMVNGDVSGDVFGGGDQGTTQGQIIVNMDGGTIHGELFGGAKGSEGSVFVAGLKTVNVRGGTVYNHVYGGSRNANDGLYFDANATNQADASAYTAFVNISGGLLRGDVYGAGYYGLMFGSSDVNIGKDAIDLANAKNINRGTHTPAYLQIIKNVYAGSNWGEYDPAVPFANSTTTGHSNVYLDGNGYDTQSLTPPANTITSTYMDLGGSIYGSGTSGDAGTQGRKIQIANFGHPILANQTLYSFDGNHSADYQVLNSSTRNMQSVQRCDTLIIDNSTVKFTGQGDISQNYNTVEYVFMYIDKGVYVRNGSNIVANTQIDEMHALFSEYRPEEVGGQPNGLYVNNPKTYWIGIGENNHQFYYIDGTTATSLDNDKINTFRFNGGYSMYVRYNKQYVNGAFTSLAEETFGELKGFFRMVTENDNETFAHARPKMTSKAENVADGGFMSYYNEYHNNFTDSGSDYTKGLQFPYENVLQTSKADRPDYRYWRIRASETGNQMVSPMAFFLYSNPSSADDFITIERTITLPTLKCTDDSYFVFSSIDYGDHAHLVNVAIDEAESTSKYWIVQKAGSTYEPQFYGKPGPDSGDLAYYQAFTDDTQNMRSHPNTYFGLVVVPEGSLEGVSNPTDPTDINKEYLISSSTAEMLSESGGHGNPAKFYYPADPNGKMAKITIRLTYYKEMTMSMALSPVTLQLKSYCGSSTDPIDIISIPIYITTQTALGQDMTTTSYAMFGDLATGNNPETYNVKATMPPFVPIGMDVPFYVYGLSYTPNQSGDVVFESKVTNFAETDYNYAMLFKRGFNSDNKSGWRESIESADTNYFQIPTGTFTPIRMGSADGRTPFSIDFTLFYNSCTPTAPRFTANQTIGQLTFDVCFPKAKDDVGLTPDPSNSENWAKFEHFSIHIDLFKRDRSTGFYLDGIAGSNNYTGSFANDGKRTLQNIIDNNWMPGDKVWVVRPITLTSSSTTWTSNNGAPIVLYRYPGSFVDPDHYSIDDTTDPDHPSWYKVNNASNPVANTGIYTDTDDVGVNHSNDDQAIFANISSKADLVLDNIILDGYNDDTNPQERPLIKVTGGGTVIITNSSEVRNSNNHQDGAEGSAVYVGDNSNLFLLNGVNIHDNKITNTTNPGNGAAVYLDKGGKLTVGGLVNITHNTVNGTFNNVYLYVEDASSEDDIKKSVVYIGEYGMDPHSVIGVTKTEFYEDGDLKDLTPIATSIYPENIHKAYTYDIFKDDTRKSYTHYFIENTLYYGKTWAHFVTSEPAGFAIDNIDSKEDLAWYLSYVNGLNGSEVHANAQAKLTANVNMSEHYWKPVGIIEDGGCPEGFVGSFDGQWNTIDGLVIKREGFHNIGLFDNVGQNGIVKNVVLGNKDSEIHPWNPDPVEQYAGGIVGTVMNGGTVTACEAAPNLSAYDATSSTYMGGVAGRVDEGGMVHSCIGMPNLEGYTMGGLVGKVEGGGYLVNSYAITRDYSNLASSSNYVGGLVGRVMSDGYVENCYVKSSTEPDAALPFGWFVGSNAGNVSYCYAPAEKTNYIYYGSAPVGYGNYDPVIDDIKALGYLYDDNKVTLAAGQTNNYHSETLTYADGRIDKWPGMLSALSHWVTEKNSITETTSPYYQKNFTPWFRPNTTNINDDLPVLGVNDYVSMSTTGDDVNTLRYEAKLDGTLTRVNANTIDDSYVFLYGKDDNVKKVPEANVHAFINEDAVLIQDDDEGGNFEATVGITFDNSWGKAHDYFENTLEYDWHLMSTPLYNAPMGTDGNYNMGAAMAYGSIQNLTKMENGYFPNGMKVLAYGAEDVKWDFYAYDEPDYHWINFKRSSRNHWHIDTINGVNNPPIHYSGLNDLGPYVNETEFVPGKGYMMAISQDSYLSNKGILNKGEIYVPLTAMAPTNEAGKPTYDKGSNLVGNPYQAYLDLEKVSAVNSTLKGYYFYNADSDNSTQGMYVPYTSGMSSNPIAPKKYIHPHQAFFVVTESNQTMTFNQSMATTNLDENAHFRNTGINYPLVNLVVSDTLGNGDLCIVEFKRPEKGGVNKINNLRNADFKLYAHYENEDYGLFFTPTHAKRVPLFFKTPNNGKYTLSWNTHNGTFTSMYLVDNLTGVHYDMLANDKYTFEAKATDYASRFYIVFSVTDVDEYDDDDINDTFAYFNGYGWMIEGEGQLELVDVLGHVLYADYLTGEQTLVHFDGIAAGMYMLRLVDGKKLLKAQKIVIR